MYKLIPPLMLALGPYLLQAPDKELLAISVTTSDHIQKDTLDWRSYYPLEVGNVWEYESWSIGPPLWRREIVGDTTVGRWRYFVFREFNHPVRPGYSFSYTRYDTLPQVIFFTDIDADTVPVPLRFDLSAHFGDTIVFHDDRGEELTFTVEGGYGGKVLGSPVAATKCFVMQDQPTCYASGIGRTDSGTLDRIELTYARTGLGEFGTERYVSVENSKPPVHGLSILNLYPTPALDAVNLHVGGATGFALSVLIYDVLGRVAYSAVQTVGVYGEVEHRADLTDLAPGYYVIKVVDEVGKSVSRPLVVVRPH